jgi:glycosyltransferase involved in cell wall biosynthesis
MSLMVQEADKATPQSAARAGSDSQPVLSLFFPCYNDAGTIASMVAMGDLTARDLTDRYEVIIIDDGSSDHSRAILKSLESRYPRLRLIFHEQNRGYGGALRSGFSNARGEWVFYTDGDYQYDVDDLRLLWQKAASGVDIVNAFKIKRHDPIYRVWIGLMYQHFIHIAFGLKIRDVDCDFRLIRQRALAKFELKEDTGCICVELVKKLQETGARFEEVGIKHMFRAYGSSQFFNFKRIWRTLTKLTRLWWKLVIRKDYDRTESAGAKS